MAKHLDHKLTEKILIDLQTPTENKCPMAGNDLTIFQVLVNTNCSIYKKFLPLMKYNVANFRFCNKILNLSLAKTSNLFIHSFFRYGFQ